MTLTTGDHYFRRSGLFQSASVWFGKERDEDDARLVVADTEGLSLADVVVLVERLNREAGIDPRTG